MPGGMSAPSTETPRFVCTCVHGTFSSDRLWSGSAATLVDFLQRQFGTSLHVRTFRWNGWNGQKSRMKAAVKLRADLYQAIHDYPSSKHVIIAHSHGGNVALYALKDAELRSRVSGLVTLATPFLFVESRRLEWVIVLTAVGAASHVAFYTLFLALMILLNGMDT